MRKLKTIAALCLLLAAAVIANASELIDRLRSQSVTVETSSGLGSGVLTQGTNGMVYVWTAAHVVMDMGGMAKNVWVTRPIWSEDGMDAIGSISYLAKVEACSEGEDLALLSIPECATNRITISTVTFPALGAKVKSGTKVIHVGSMRGLPESVSTGEVSGTGRRLPGSPKLDQVTCSASPGSSGGGVWNAKTGELLGLINSGYSDSMCFMTPARSMQAWAASIGMGWACPVKCAKGVQE